MQTVETESMAQLAVGAAFERIVGWVRENRAPEGLSASALSALIRLENSGALRVTELAHHEGLTQPGMTTLLHRLEAAGLATRQPDPDDGRAVLVTVTPAGVQRVLEYRSARAARVAARIAELSEADQRLLVAALPALDHFAVGDANPPQKEEEA
jgi:DNA-binding MarR family transcriptional regulator